MQKLVTLEKESIKAIQAEVLKALTCFRNQEEKTIRNMFSNLSTICRIFPKSIILMIDEVDSESNNQVLIDFFYTAQEIFLDREKRPIFHLVIFAGVYDIKNIKLKYATMKIISTIVRGILPENLRLI